MKSFFLTLLSFIALQTFAQSDDSGRGFSYAVEMSGTISNGAHSPLWLSANRYGLSSTERNSGYIRRKFGRTVMNDSIRHLMLSYNTDFVVPVNYTSSFVVQQLYAEAKWRKGVLTIGQKEHPMQLKDNKLSSGSQTFGINARPYPEIRLALPDYWEIPGTKSFLAFKGHIAWGAFTDNRFQKHFAENQATYHQNVLMHTKAGYLRFGTPQKPFNIEAGIELASQFGSTHYEYTDQTYKKIQNARNLAAFWHAFIGGGADAEDGATQNNEGNMLGSWVLRLNYDTQDATYGLYADHFFEDHSGMFMLDYDGYAYENGNIKKKKNKYIMYPLKDIMLGFDVHLKKGTWFNAAVIEYIYTKYQSGPVYVDRTSNMTSHIGGIDDYYNNRLEPGWVHWGQAIGNPLYLSPIYNTDHSLKFQCNRFTAWNMGLSGKPTNDLQYRLRLSWQEGYGTYNMPYPTPHHNVSLSIEVSQDLHKIHEGVSICGGFGIDRGDLMGDNTGGMLTLRFEK